MDDTELQTKISELRQKRRENQEEQTYELYDIPPKEDKSPKKDDGFLGVLTFQSIIVVFLGILYILALTFCPKEIKLGISNVKMIMSDDFSFKDAIYETVGDILTELNKITPVDANEGEPVELNGIGGDKPSLLTKYLPYDATLADVIYTGSITYPLAGGRITSEYGLRSNHTTGKSEFHNAVDIATQKGSDIYAVADGVVIQSGFDKYLGNYVKIDHSNGFITKYGHCDKLLVEENTVVREGEVIAKVGSTGDSTGPHVHFAAQKNGVYFNPLYLYTYIEKWSVTKSDD